MARKFTNALNETPLWQFAIEIYRHHQSELLHWQDHHGANVNRLITLAYGMKNQMRLVSVSPYVVRIEQQINAVRQQRKLFRIHPEHYDRIKAFELELEGLHLMLLAQALQTGDINYDVDSYEKTLGVKKGALAPFLIQLVN